jgi:thymidylate synthase ThyX
MPDRRIYLLSPRDLSPETIAVAFAKTSRSPESFSEIASGLTEEKSAKFHEKWVVGYGHASVAEHAVLHIAFENVSRLAIESIESNRLASYTEKSTRYQKWAPDDFFVPSELDGHALRAEYIAVCRFLFKTYAESLEPVRTVVFDRTPRRADETDEALDRRVRSQYVDACRFLLPAASLANVGMTVNARALENTIRKMLSHRLEEVREIGAQVKVVAKDEVPTLVKYAEAVPYISETSMELNGLAREIGSAEHQQPAAGEWCKLVDYDPDGENKILAAALYRFGGQTYEDVLGHVRHLGSGERSRLAESLLSRLGEHDIPLRELEHTDYTFDLVMDQGAYAEFKRHRMMTQTAQRLTARLGYSVPRLMVDAGIGAGYESALEAAAGLYEKLELFDPYVAQYVVPNGFHRRILAKFNLREAYAFCQLRAAPNAHFSIRRIAQRISKELTRVHPLLARYMRLPDESWQGVEASHFAP